MAVSLSRRFRGKEPYVLSLVRQMGVSQAMIVYKLKNRKSFLRWVGQNSNIGDLPTDPLEKMSGGEKHIWLKNHRETVLDCLQIWGEDWVKMNFHFTHDTLYSFLKSSEPPRPGSNQIDELLKDVERLKSLCEIEHGDYIEVIEGQKRLEQSVLSFAQEITKRLAQVIAKPLLEHIIGPDAGELNPELPGGKHKLDLNIVEGEINPKPHQSDIDSLITQSERLVEQQATDDNPLAETIKRAQSIK